MQVINLIMICPYCGGSEWFKIEDEENEFECATCYKYAFPDEMRIRASDEKHPLNLDD